MRGNSFQTFGPPGLEEVYAIIGAPVIGAGGILAIDEDVQLQGTQGLKNMRTDCSPS